MSKHTIQYHLGAKVQKQMTKRGWTTEEIEEILRNPSRTIPRQDIRYFPDGSRMNEPATAYVRQDGHYIVRNNRTGDIVQISNRNDPGWRAPF